MQNNHKSCLHFDPVKIGHSENHNMRLGEIPSYVNQSLIHLNEYYVEKDIKPLDKAIREAYQKRVGQRMQDKQNPIKECSVNILSTTTMDDLKNLATELEKRYGIHCFQIHIHRDEGHNNKKFIDPETGKKRLIKATDAEWTPNYHAHMLWDFTDQETGESLNRKIRSFQLSEIQTLVAELLVMERGEKGSKKKRRSSQEQHLYGLEKDVEFAQDVLEQTNAEIKEKQAKNESINELLKVKLQNYEALEKATEKLNAETKKSKHTIVKGVAGWFGRDDEVNKLNEKIAEQGENIEILESQNANLVDENNKIMQMFSKKDEEINKQKMLVSQLQYKYDALEKQFSKFKNFVLGFRKAFRILFSKDPSYQQKYATVFSYLTPFWKSDDENAKRQKFLEQRKTPQIKVGRGM